MLHVKHLEGKEGEVFYVKRSEEKERSRCFA